MNPLLDSRISPATGSTNSRLATSAALLCGLESSSLEVICSHISTHSLKMDHIPDLSEIQTESLALQVADAPLVPVSRIMKPSLDSNGGFEKKIAAAVGVQIETNLLTRFLEPASDLNEVDRPWNYQSLHQTIKSSIQAD